MKSIILFSIFVTLTLISSTPVSAVSSIDEIILKQKQKQWRIGDNLNSGDSYTYQICDDKTFTHSNFNEKCYFIQLDFYDLLNGPIGKTWIVQSLVYTDNITISGIFQINPNTFEITASNQSNAKFAQSIQNTLFEISNFANPATPKLLQVGQIWGNIPSYLNDSDIIVIHEDTIQINEELIDIFSVGYTVKNTSVYFISKQLPFPVWAKVYSPTIIFPEPDLLFSVELIQYKQNDTADVSLDFDGVISHSKSIEDTTNNNLICIPKELLITDISIDEQHDFEQIQELLENIDYESVSGVVVNSQDQRYLN